MVQKPTKNLLGENTKMVWSDIPIHLRWCRPSDSRPPFRPELPKLDLPLFYPEPNHSLIWLYAYRTQRLLLGSQAQQRAFSRDRLPTDHRHADEHVLVDVYSAWKTCTWVLSNVWAEFARRTSGGGRE